MSSISAICNSGTSSELATNENNEKFDEEAPPHATENRPTDDNIVDWDGPDDPANPLNWPKWKSFGHIIMVSVLSLIVNIGATIAAPGVLGLIKEFHVTNQTVATLSISIYILGFALGPLLVSSLSEMYGRLPVYHICNLIFVAFVIACSVSTNISQFVVFRFLSGFAGSAPLTIGGGTIADCIPIEKRGGAGALFGLGPLLGPVLGPVMGGFLAENKGWRWTFRLVAIMGGSASLFTFICMRETNPQTLLERKAERLRRETGNPNLASKLDTHLQLKQVLFASVTRPIKLLIFSPIVLILSIYVALIFGLLYLLFNTFPTVFKEQYGFSTGVSGLVYLGVGVGEMIGVVIFAKLGDKLMQAQMIADKVTKPKPEYRLILMMWFAPVIPVGLFIYGWTAYYKTHWIAPVIGAALFGYGTFFVIITSQLYLVDIFGSDLAASSLGASIVLRSLAGTFLPIAGPHMFKKLNYGWGNTLLGFLALLFIPAPFIFYKYGQFLRERTIVKI